MPAAEAGAGEEERAAGGEPPALLSLPADLIFEIYRAIPREAGPRFEERALEGARGRPALLAACRATRRAVLECAASAAPAVLFPLLPPAELLARAPGLAHLDLTARVPADARRLAAEGLPAVAAAARAGRRVASLSASLAGPCEPGLLAAALAPLGSLRSLSLDVSGVDPAEYASAVRALTGLTSLSLEDRRDEGAWGGGGAGACFGAALGWVETLSGLRSLSVAGFEGVRGGVFPGLAGLTALTELRVRRRAPALDPDEVALATEPCLGGWGLRAGRLTLERARGDPPPAAGPPSPEHAAAVASVARLPPGVARVDYAWAPGP